MNGPYVALSYCWGPNPEFYRLTAESYDDLQQGIPYFSLPIAFREAIELIKSLSIRYLWVDALCIIQSGVGSTEDWLIESISCPGESCLTGSSTNTIPPFEVHTANLLLDSTKSEKCTVILQDYYRDALYNQPLGLRAWALQERILAPRVLSLGHGELFWDCIQVPHASESFPQGLDDGLNLFGLKFDGIPNTSNQGELENVWWEIREDYTNRALTYPEKDKLMALSAVAARMGDAMHDVYIAGHFWKMLPFSLYWEAKQPERVGTRDKGVKRRYQPSDDKIMQSTIPSWSWASMDGRVSESPPRWYESLAKL